MISHDGEANLSQTYSGTTTTLSSKTTAGVNRYAEVTVDHSQPVASGFPTYGGVQMTLLGTPLDIGDGRLMSMYGIADPPTAATNIVCNFTSSSNGTIGCSSYSSPDSPIQPKAGTYQTAAGAASPSGITLTSENGDIGIDFLLVEAPSPTPGAGQTQNYSVDNGTYFHFSSREPSIGATTAMTETFSDADWDQVAITLEESGAPAATTLPFITVLDAKRI